MWFAGLPVAFALPSPKLQENVYGLVPPEALAVKVTCWPAAGDVGVKLKVAVSACGATVTAWPMFAVLALPSAAVTETW